MFINEVALIKKENINQLEKLNEDDREAIGNIMKSMSIFKVNSYDAQVIQRDLIGMTQELKLRNSSLDEAIGEDIKGFTAEIIESSNKASGIEILLKFLIKLSGYFFIWFLGSAYGAFGKLSWNANPIIYLLYFGTVLILFVTEGIISPIFSLEKGFKRYIPSIISMVLFIFLMLIVYTFNDMNYTTKVYGGYIALVSGISFIVLKYLDNRNIHRLSKDKRNYIADLMD